MDVSLAPPLCFAGWTAATLAGTFGVHRGSHVLTGRASVAQRRADEAGGPDGSRRAMRAHPNGVENLPVDGAVVSTVAVPGVASVAYDALPLTFMETRTGQILVQVAIPQTGRVARVRFSPLAVQLACMTAVGAIVGATMA